MTFRDFNPDSATGERSNHFFYRRFITGPQGAHYELLKEAHHTIEDLKAAKAYLRRNYDVVTIKVIRETITPKQRKKQIA